MPGGFHPFHAGHMALYNAAREAFPSADIFVAATDDTSGRPFPFKTKKFLAQQAGVPGNRFIRVKSPFRAEEITQMYDPNETQLIFVRSEKDAQKQPQPGGVKRDGSASYLQPYKRTGLEPFSKHGYMAYLPTVQFGPGMTSATEIRAKWPEMSPEEKISLVKVMYPSTATKEAAAGKIVSMFDEIMGEKVEEFTNVTQTTQSAVDSTDVTQTQGGGETTRTSTYSGPAAPTQRELDLEMKKQQRIDQLRAQGKKGVQILRDPEVMRLNRELRSIDEATLVNDPDAGHLIRPDGGMGTWNEQSLKSNLARKFASMLEMLKSGDYAGLHYVLKKGQVVDSMVTALAQYQKFMDRQGRRPIAQGREIDLGQMSEDYIDESKKK